MKDHDWRYKIGKAATNMLRLTDLGVPNPDQVVYEPYQKDEMRGDLTWAGRGYQSFKMVWDILSVDQMNTLNRFLFASQNAVTGYGWLYTSVDDGWSKNAGNSFHLYEVNVKRPLLNSQDGQRVVRSARAYSSVAYYFTIISQEEADFTSNFVTGSYYPVSVTFTDTSTAGQLTWLWDFGDGGTSTAQNPTHIYTTAGSFNVTLTTTSQYGTNTTTKTAFITVRAPIQPAAAFSADLTATYHQHAVQFSDLSTGDITTWLWTFGDGTTSALQNPSKTYAAAGNYTVALTVSNPTQTDTETKVAYITIREPIAPVAAFSADETLGWNPLDVTFTDASTGDAISGSWSWDFGDGDTSTDQNPVHTYDALGTYTVALTVTGPEASDTETKTNYITIDDMETRVKATMSANLIAYWMINDASGATAVEEVNDYDATITNGSWTTTGLGDGTVSLSGSALANIVVDYSDAGGALGAAFDGDSCTISMWVQRLSWNTGGTLANLIRLYGISNQEISIRVIIRDYLSSYNHLGVYRNIPGAGGACNQVLYFLPYNLDVYASTWHNITATIDVAADEMLLYFDGVAVGSRDQMTLPHSGGTTPFIRLYPDRGDGVNDTFTVEGGAYPAGISIQSKTVGVDYAETSPATGIITFLPGKLPVVAEFPEVYWADTTLPNWTNSGGVSINRVTMSLYNQNYLKSERLCHVAIWDGPLTPAEILALATRGPGGTV